MTDFINNFFDEVRLSLGNVLQFKWLVSPYNNWMILATILIVIVVCLIIILIDKTMTKILNSLEKQHNYNTEKAELWHTQLICRDLIDKKLSEENRND